MGTMTDDTLALFDALIEDAPNWSGNPLVQISAAQRGNLTDLKARGLIETFTDRGDAFVHFTAEGVALALARGFDLSELPGVEPTYTPIAPRP